LNRLSRRESGFTLIELLIVLSVVAVLSVIMIPSMVKTVYQIQTNHFFKTMDSDLLYVQNQSLGQSDYLRIVFQKDHYQIRDTYANQIKRQPYPKDMTLKQTTYVISFSRSGTIKNAGAIVLQTEDQTYQVTFPLGKGRHYVETK